jgi:hypothetical protein
VSWANYTFYFNTLQINQMLSQSNDNPDVDSAYFAVQVGGMNQPCPACMPNAGPPGAFLGPVTNFYDPFTGSTQISLYGSMGPQAWGQEAEPNATEQAWSIGPLPIQDTDSVTVLIAVTNLNQNKNPSAGEYIAEGLKIGGDIDAALAAGVSVADPEIGGILALFAGIVESVGEILGWADLLGAPVCAGPVLQEAYNFTGIQLQQACTTPTPVQQTYFTTFIESNLTENAPGSGCNVPNSTLMWAVLCDQSVGEMFPSGPPSAPPPQLRPAPASRAPRDWVSPAAAWGDGSTTADSRVVCYVTATGNGPVEAGNGQAAAESYLGGLIDTLRNEPAAGDLLGASVGAVRAGALSIPQVPQAPPELRTTTLAAMPVTARYAVNLTQAWAPDQDPFNEVSASDLAELPMLVTAFTADVYPSPAGTPEHEVSVAVASPVAQTAPVAPLTTDQAPGLRAEGAESTIQPASVATGVEASASTDAVAETAAAAIASSWAVPPSYAASILPSANDSLQLYANYDPDDTLVGYQLRYTHTDGAGQLTTDVMLGPISEPLQ